MLAMNKMMKSWKALSTAIITSALCACGTPMTPDFGEMSAKYANILEQYQIDMLFQNILRASEDRPVSFLDMPSINGSGSITVNPYASGLFSGGVFPANAAYLPIQGGLSTLSPGVSLSVGNTFNFTQSSLDNAVFWKGYLNELPLEYVKYFEHNHIPKEVILSLVIDEIQITKASGEEKIFINNPLRPDYAEFQKHLYRLISFGLGAYEVNTSKKIGPPITPDQARSRFGGGGFEMMKESGIVMQQVGNPSKMLFQPIQLSKAFKLCIKKNQYENFVREEYGDSIFCEKTPAQDLVQDSSTKQNQSRLAIRIRSTNNIFEYLGQTIKAQLKDHSYMVTVPPSANTFNNKNGQSNQYALFVVTKDMPVNKPFSSVQGLDGSRYSIPGEDNGYSQLTIKLLAQFMALQKIPGSIPPSPAVLIK